MITREEVERVLIARRTQWDAPPMYSCEGMEDYLTLLRRFRHNETLEVSRDEWREAVRLYAGELNEYANRTYIPGKPAFRSVDSEE